MTLEEYAARCIEVDGSRKKYEEDIAREIERKSCEKLRKLAYLGFKDRR
jgi:hypothetical protein